MFGSKQHSWELGGKLLTTLIVFRVLNALIVRTSFTPDEFWQGPEPAHLLAFGRGHLTWEWLPSARIRGYTHPLIFAVVYRALALLGLDTRWAIAHSPKLVQAVLAGFCDYFAFGLAWHVFGPGAAGWALLFQVSSWFNFYCLVRPYSNSAEAALATAALYYWAPYCLPSSQRDGKGGRRGGAGTSTGTAAEGLDHSKMLASSREYLALCLAALCVAVRPTSAAFWVVVGLLRLSRLPLSRWVKYLAVTVLPPLASLLGASVYLDSMLYGVSTFVPFNFLRFNVLTGGSRIFGEHPWHWNFSQGLPAVLSVGLVPALWAILRGDGDGGRGSRVLGWLVAWFLVYHSASPHKELRFLLPVLPMAHACAGQAVMTWLRASTCVENNRFVADRGYGESPSRAKVAPTGAASSSRLNRKKRRRRLVMAALVCGINAPIAIYLSVWHQSGALSAVDEVAKRIPAVAATNARCTVGAYTGKGTESAGKTAEGNGEGEGGESVVADVVVHFLMPCHSTPFYSHLHFRDVNASLWSLDCSPTNRASPGDSESDRFQANPLAFLEATYGRGPGTGDPYSPPPDLAVMYSTHFDSPGVSSFLSSLGLERAEVVFNAHVNGDADSADTHHGVVVLERTSCLS